MSDRPVQRVVIAGGGVAAIEALLALRAEPDVPLLIGLLAPRAAFVYRPLAVAEPFGRAVATRFDLAEIAAEQDALLHRDALAAVDVRAGEVETMGGDRLPFDALLVAVGAQAHEALAGVLTFAGPASSPDFARLLGQLERGELRSVTFAVPPGRTWPLPIYELALLTADHLATRGVQGVALRLVTPEQAPLESFGEAASRSVGELLGAAGIELHLARAPAAVEDGSLLLEGGGAVPAERVVAAPALAGPFVDGLPHDDHGFLPIDRHCRVPGADGVYAAGDATTQPVKHGSLAAQQADAAAADILALAGAPITPAPFRPQLRGVLLAGHGLRYLRAPGEHRRSAASEDPLWRPGTKVAGRHLAAYLRSSGTPGAGRLLEELSAGRAATAAREHQDALALALESADAEAGWGDYRAALRWLRAAEELSIALPSEYAGKRRRWTEALGGGS